MKSSTDKEALLLLTHLIEFVYRLLWGDLFPIPLPGGVSLQLSFMVVLLFTPAAPVFCRCGCSGI